MIFNMKSKMENKFLYQHRASTFVFFSFQKVDFEKMFKKRGNICKEKKDRDKENG